MQCAVCICSLYMQCVVCIRTVQLAYVVCSLYMQCAVCICSMYTQWVACTCSVQFVYVVCSVYMLVPISQTFPPSPPRQPGNHKAIFHICDSFRFVNQFICTLSQIPFLLINKKAPHLQSSPFPPKDSWGCLPRIHSTCYIFSSARSWSNLS